MTKDDNTKDTKSIDTDEFLVSEAADIAKKDAELAKQMASLVKFKVKKLRKLKSKITEKHQVKALNMHEKKIMESPKDVNEVIKSSPRLSQNKVKIPNSKAQDTEVKVKNQGKHSAPKSESRKGNDDDSTGNDVNNSTQSASAISGSYDVELELEPGKLEYSKGGAGKMSEKRIKIKNMTTDGKNRKISPVTFGKILKAIRQVEGILGFTIEKQEKVSKKTHKKRKHL
ncbi:hypothetical protein QZH41_000608 [Actinostola sp. cb2023]|nr:hypothetical protein QZH41_000608 [Actinostola sp. cb2023]